jgi:hypothetical protein
MVLEWERAPVDPLRIRNRDSARIPADAPYFLAPHVYAARTSDYLVLLDLEGDEYFGINTTLQVDQAIDSSAHADLIAQLAHRGFLTRGSAAKCPARAALEPLSQLPTEPPDAAPIAGGILDAARVLRAVYTVRAVLRLRSLRYAIERTTRRKGKESTTDPSLPLVAAQVAIFRKFAPWTFSARRACLLDSLMLAELLASTVGTPTLLIGVSTSPFRAHSWLQYGHVVVNDTPEYVRQFTPILVA